MDVFQFQDLFLLNGDKLYEGTISTFIFYYLLHKLKRGEFMKKKGLLIFTFFMLILNTVCFLYVDYAMQQDMSIYVLQVGRYKEKENANQIINQLKELEMTSYFYQDQEYVIIQDIYLEERQANQQAKELSQKGITCVVKEYLIDESYQEEIQKKNYKRIYPLLKQVDTK